VRIALIIEGKTEKAFLPHLRRFLETRLSGKMPKFDPVPFDGRIPKGDKLKRNVERLLDENDAVIALTDIYTGSIDFQDGNDAKNKMRKWVGPNGRFYPHAAQYEFETWLIPYWNVIQKLAGHDKSAPSGEPERIDHDKPPSHYIQEIFRIGGKSRSYIKARDVSIILHNQDFLISAQQCPEFKAFLNTILGLCGGQLIPCISLPI
jgi:hypothetical protein